MAWLDHAIGQGNEAGGVIYVAGAATLYSQSDTVFPDVLGSQVLGAAATDPVCSSGVGSRV